MQKRWAKLRRGDKEEEKREVRGGGGMRSETEEEREERGSSSSQNINSLSLVVGSNQQTTATLTQTDPTSEL